LSTHATAYDGEKNKKKDQREEEQNEYGCDDGNFATGLSPTENAENQGCKRSEKQDSDNEREKRNTKKAKGVVVVGDHNQVPQKKLTVNRFSCQESFSPMCSHA
jgi:hypothetical protein